MTKQFETVFEGIMQALDTNLPHLIIGNNLSIKLPSNRMLHFSLENSNIRIYHFYSVSYDVKVTSTGNSLDSGEIRICDIDNVNMRNGDNNNGIWVNSIADKDICEVTVSNVREFIPNTINVIKSLIDFYYSNE